MYKRLAWRNVVTRVLGVHAPDQRSAARDPVHAGGREDDETPDARGSTLSKATSSLILHSNTKPTSDTRGAAAHPRPRPNELHDPKNTNVESRDRTCYTAIHLVS